jgi:hypothetical protein
VYAIIAGLQSQVVKLGKSAAHPSQRLAELQTGNHVPLHLLAYTHHLSERAVHRRWRNLKVNGEWFKLNKGLLLEVKSWDWIDTLLWQVMAERVKLIWLRAALTK